MNKINKLLVLILAINVLAMILLILKSRQIKKEYENFTEIVTFIDENEVQ